MARFVHPPRYPLFRRPERAITRRLRLLGRGVDGIPIHCEGGMALRDPDIRFLIRRGLLRIGRRSYGSVWAHDLSHPADLRRTFARTTETGLVALETRRLAPC